MVLETTAISVKLVTFLTRKRVTKVWTADILLLVGTPLVVFSVLKEAGNKSGTHFVILRVFWLGTKSLGLSKCTVLFSISSYMGREAMLRRTILLDGGGPGWGAGGGSS